MEHHNKIEYVTVQLEGQMQVRQVEKSGPKRKQFLFGRSLRVAGENFVFLVVQSLFLTSIQCLLVQTTVVFFTQFPKVTSHPFASRRDLLAAAPAAVAPVMPGAPAQAAAKAEIAHNRSLKAAKPFFRIFYVHSKCEDTF